VFGAEGGEASYCVNGMFFFAYKGGKEEEECLSLVRSREEGLLYIAAKGKKLPQS